jgi:hypothetical protein
MMRAIEEEPSDVRHVMALFASEADGQALDQAVDIAARWEARLTIAVPVAEPSGLVYTSPIPICPLNEDLEREAEGNANAALRRVPREVPVTVRFIKGDTAADVLDDGLPPVDLLVYRSRPRRRPRRPISSLMRAAKRGGVPVLLINAVGI